MAARVAGTAAAARRTSRATSKWYNPLGAGAKVAPSAAVTPGKVTLRNHRSHPDVGGHPGHRHAVPFHVLILNPDSSLSETVRCFRGIPPALHLGIYEQIRYSYTALPSVPSFSFHSPTVHPNVPQNRRNPRFFFFSSVYVPLLL